MHPQAATRRRLIQLSADAPSPEPSGWLSHNQHWDGRRYDATDACWHDAVANVGFVRDKAHVGKTHMSTLDLDHWLTSARIHAHTAYGVADSAQRVPELLSGMSPGAHWSLSQ